MITAFKKIKLYVWEDVLVDYTGGVMFALAYSVAEAREVIKRDAGTIIEKDLEKDPYVTEVSEGFACWGGG